MRIDVIREASRARIVAHRGRSRYQLGVGRDIERGAALIMGKEGTARMVSGYAFEENLQDQYTVDRVNTVVHSMSRVGGINLAPALSRVGANYQTLTSSYGEQFNGALQLIGYGLGGLAADYRFRNQNRPSTTSGAGSTGAVFNPSRPFFDPFE